MISAELHRVRAERQAGAPLHPQEPAAVQTVGLRHVAGVRVHGVRGHHAQHALPGHEVLSTAQGKISLEVPSFGSCIKKIMSPHDKKADDRRCSNISLYPKTF